MEILLVVLLFIGVTFIGMGAGTLLLGGRIMSFFVFIGLFLVLISRGMGIETAKGKPTSHQNTYVLTVGEKYEVVAVYDGNGKYIVTKSLAKADEKEIRLIGPLNFGTTSVGVGDVCIKTAEGSLEKFLRH